MDDVALIRDKMLEAGLRVMDHGDVGAFLAICSDDIVFTVKEGGEVHRLQGKPALRGFLVANAPPRTPGGKPPEIKTAIIGSEAVSILDLELSYRQMGCVRAVLRWRKEGDQWLLREYTETDVELGMFAEPEEEWVWPAKRGVGLPFEEELQQEVLELAAEAEEEVAANPNVDWPNTRIVVVDADGNGTTTTATIRTNNGPNPVRSFGYNTDLRHEEMIYDSKGNRLAVRKRRQKPTGPGRYGVVVTFMEPLGPGESEATFKVWQTKGILRKRGAHWVYQWRNYPGVPCYDTLRLKFPATFEVVEARPEPTHDYEDGDLRSVTWQTVVPKGSRVNNVIVLKKPVE